MTLDEIYHLCLTAHALKWIESYRTLDRAVYLEMHGGPIIAKCMHHYGVQQVISDFIEKTVAER